jgi:hypothetical protein
MEMQLSKNSVLNLVNQLNLPKQALKREKYQNLKFWIKNQKQEMEKLKYNPKQQM